MRKEACVIASGRWQGHRILVKNRDRAYNPTIRVVHTILGGTEVMYLEDLNSGWVEGLNEYGIGILNSALAVQQDEEEGVTPSADKGDKKTPKLSEDRYAILTALQAHNLRDAVRALRSLHLGARGHTFVATDKRLVSLERTDGNDSKKILDDRRPHARTNHGLRFPNSGYQEGEDLVSSLMRRSEALSALHSVETIAQVAPALWNRREKRYNPVRLDGKVYTTSQMLLDVTDLEMRLYCLPDKVEFLGVRTDLPEGYAPKISFRLYRYESTDVKGPTRVGKVPVDNSPVALPHIPQSPPPVMEDSAIDKVAARVASLWILRDVRLSADRGL